MEESEQNFRIKPVGKRRPERLFPVRPLQDAHSFPSHPIGFNQSLKGVIRFMQEQAKEYHVKAVIQIG